MRRCLDSRASRSSAKVTKRQVDLNRSLARTKRMTSKNKRMEVGRREERTLSALFQPDCPFEASIAWLVERQH